MNCFQIVSLKYRSTTEIFLKADGWRLWIAFRLYLWNIGQQLVFFPPFLYSCCELLSDCIFEISVNNGYCWDYNKEDVVNCFQIVSLKYRSTTLFMVLDFSLRLWIAFRLYLWNIGQQLFVQPLNSSRCCELLSDCIFEISVNNFQLQKDIRLLVVNCFQIVSLKYRSTTYCWELANNVLLWIAFRLYLWNIGQQLRQRSSNWKRSCELLSDCIFEISVNNCYWSRYPLRTVVNCFQIVSLKYRSTTDTRHQNASWQLWIAFRLYLWNIGQQHLFNKRSCRYSCELLSDCIFEISVNNEEELICSLKLVVNCFQIVSLKYRSTTVMLSGAFCLLLWIAFRLYLWNIGQQHGARKS